MFKPATDSELEQYIIELEFWRDLLKDYPPERCDYFDLFRNELPEMIEEKLTELNPTVQDTAAVLLMADKKIKTIKHWFNKIIFKTWVYDVANERFQIARKEQKRLLWLRKRLEGTDFNPGITPEEFKENNPILETIERYTHINSQGFAKCPLHNERTASLKVYPKNNSWYCFGACQTGGDVIDFLCAIKNVSFNDLINGKIIY
ncbi:MAG: CHC2 zinc finger domain-containing protein [Nanoarchaeota archaeon]